MDRKTLLIFAKRIFNSASTTKAVITLGQLKTILEQQGAPKSDLQLIDTMIQSAPEMKDISQKPFLTEQDIIVAERRAQERKAREEAARYSGRC